MNVLCFGLNHKTAPLDVRERMAIGASKLAETNAAVIRLPGVAESVVLSTCNRTEFYAALRADAAADPESLRAGTREIERWVRRNFSVPDADMADFYALRGVEAARHLCMVSGGLDSMVLGETEIFGQVKSAYREAHAGGTTAGALNQLFQQAFRIGKYVRTHSGITSGATSVGAVAVDLAEKIFGRLEHCAVMVIGAGEMSRRTTQSLISRGARGIIVSNRSHDRAVALAAEMGGRAIRFDECYRTIHEIDIVIASTAAPHLVLRAEDLHPVMRRRRGRPLFVIDIAVPRDVEPAVGAMQGVYLYDIDALETIARDGRDHRRQQIDHCLGLIDEQLRTLGLRDDPGAATRPAARVGDAAEDRENSGVSPRHPA